MKSTIRALIESFASFTLVFGPWVIVFLAFSRRAAAEVPASVTEVLTEGKADGLAVAGAVLSLIVAIRCFKYIERYLLRDGTSFDSDGHFK